MFMCIYSFMLLHSPCEALDGSMVQPIEYVYVPAECSRKSEDDDHLMLRYSLKNAATPESPPLFFMTPWQQQHYQLGNPETPSAFSNGLRNMCPGEKRRLTFSAEDFDFSHSEAMASPIIQSDVELLSITPSGDYYIFELIEKGDVAGIMEMVDNHGTLLKCFILLRFCDSISVMQLV